MKLTLGASEKLKSRKQITQLFDEGLSLKEYPIRLRFLKVYEVDSQFKVSFSVPKRNVKLAVNRNRIKRLLRETYRLNKHILIDTIEGNFVLMFIYTDRTEWEYQDLEKKMISVLHKFVENQKDG
ncbi:MAG: ribonuclease P protein component [Flavobacteriaceae bacterium]